MADYIKWSQHISGEYGEGQGYVSNNKGESWDSFSSRDYNFKIAGEEHFKTGYYTPIDSVDRWVAQTFTPQSNQTISSVELYISRYNEPGMAQVMITATDGDGVPTGENPAMGTFNADDLGTSYEWKVISISSVSLTADVKYACILAWYEEPEVVEPYFLWGEGLKLDFTDHNGNKRRLLGIKEGQTSKTAHQVSVQGLKLGYIDVDGDERRLPGTKQGFTGKSPYQVSIQGTKLAFIDENGDERYIDTGAKGNSNAFNEPAFN